ncbi:MAG TPA: YhjD/YihY/BrkB family envelope integrity protein [Opitutaceae bacterium]|nr:YhjD/YihY/BrkB family envelope integrity protein [Opitutaceae bacterium]
MPFQGIGTRLSRLWHKDIWQAALLSDRSLKGWFYALLRAVSISATSFSETKTLSRAADLSFSSMLGLGPLIAIAMLVASTVLGERNPNLASDALNRVITFVAPQLTQYESLNNGGAVAVNPQLVALIDGFIKGAQSDAVGVAGALLLVVIVLFLFKSIEDAFNDIWGVRRGRSILTRVVVYWTVLTLGGVVFFAAVALLGAGAFAIVFVGRLPFGAEIVQFLRWSLPSFSFVLLVGVLVSFYRAIPNTRVRWSAALSGALVVAVLLSANNVLGFLYLKRVLLTKSLFGSLGIIPVLMFGLYVFWLFVLVGGQISYAVQNVHSRNSQLAWGGLSPANRERLSLAVLMAICRRFHACQPPMSVPELSEAVRVPTQVLNECLNRIVDLGFVMSVPQAHDAHSAGALYQPARPLNRITLLQFKLAADNRGADASGVTIDRIDPVVGEFRAAIERLGEQAFFRKSVEELIAEAPAGK